MFCAYTSRWYSGEDIGMIEPVQRVIRKPSYRYDFAVLAPPERPDLFFMNMRVYELLPVQDCVDETSKSILIWRAVHRTSRPRRP